MERPTISEKRRVYNWLVKNWWLSVIVVSLPSGTATFITVFGRNTIVNNDGTLPTGWFIFLLILFLGAFVFSILKFKTEKMDNIKRENAYIFYKDILDKDNDFLVSRMNDFSKITLDNSKLNLLGLDESKRITIDSQLSSVESIKRRLGYICSLLSNVFDIQQSKIGISIITRSKTSGWKYLAQINIDGHDLKLDELTRDKHSTFNTVQAGGSEFFRFYPDKNSAREKNEYIPNKNEQDQINRGNRIIGSIYCKNISLVLNESTLLETIFTITTYGRQMCFEDDKVAINKVCQLFEYIESHLRYELAKICMYKHIGLYLE